VFLVVALLMMMGVHRGEAVKPDTLQAAEASPTTSTKPTFAG